MIGNVNRPFIAVDQCFLYSEGRQPKKMVVAFSVYIQYMFVVVWKAWHPVNTERGSKGSCYPKQNYVILKKS